MNVIHPTAIVHSEAKLGENNYIGPYCLIEKGVTIGNYNRFEGYVSIGTAAEHRDYFRNPPKMVEIKDHNVVREFVTINAGTTNTTTIGSRVNILRGAHLGHDAVVEDDCNISCNVMVGGHSILGKGANVGLSATIHQLRVIGAFAMIGMNSTVTRHIPPFMIAFGSPCEPQRVNRIGLQRGGVPDCELEKFESWFQEYRRADTFPKLDHDFNRFLTKFIETIDLQRK